MRRLERRGIIQGYRARIDEEALGYGCRAFLLVALEKVARRAEFESAMIEMPEVLECHAAAGECDYVLKVCCRDAKGLARFVHESVQGAPGVARAQVSIVLRTAKEFDAPWREA